MVDVSPEQVLACLRDFPKASAPGPSGWRAQHILELVTGLASTVCAETLQALAPFVGLALSGCLEHSFANSMTSAPLFPLRKANEGIHPITVGETLRRLIAKAAVAKWQGLAIRKLLPLQVGGMGLRCS